MILYFVVERQRKAPEQTWSPHHHRWKKVEMCCTNGVIGLSSTLNHSLGCGLELYSSRSRHDIVHWSLNEVEISIFQDIIISMQQQILYTEISIPINNLLHLFLLYLWILQNRTFKSMQQASTRDDHDDDGHDLSIASLWVRWRLKRHRNNNNLWSAVEQNLNSA